MVEVAKNNGKQAAWRDPQTFKPTPNQPYPPPGWGNSGARPWILQKHRYRLRPRERL